MKVLPIEIKNRPEINLRHGIKTSLPEIKELFSLYLSIYLVNGEKSSIDFADEITGPPTKIKIKPQLFAIISTFFSNQITRSSYLNFEDKVNANPLFKAQMEALQVTLELFWKLGSIKFNAGYPSSQERTGGSRFAKTILFSTNATILRYSLSDSSNNISEELKDILFNWIINESILPENAGLTEKIKSLLTIMSEETQFKIRESESVERYFQQEGIYEGLVENNTVESKDFREEVGPFRILKSFVRSGLHKYLVEGTNEFNLNTSFQAADLTEYLNKVTTTLNLIPKRTTIIEIEKEGTTESAGNELHNSTSIPFNLIYFGAPGTGKSRAISTYAPDINTIKVTFHPDTDYSSFVGSYKPTQKDDGSGEITYQFVPQPFLESYLKAWETTENVFLVVEEINRGNCAQIFGDIFQALDRDENGYSKYMISIDTEIARYIKTHFEKLNSSGESQKAERYLNYFGEKFDKLALPNNLFIHATMNTSDQSLFPMDSAFKRRWDWKYIPIDLTIPEAKEYQIELGQEVYSWISFIEKVNEKIEVLTESEDKKLGPFFIKSYNNLISADTFISKVLFYIWNDILKDEPKGNPKFFFREVDHQPFSFNQLFRGNSIVIELAKSFMDYLEVDKQQTNDIIQTVGNQNSED